ncbi:glycoside hydrolase superfamily [Chytriomyces cf. hyalinus JEL632]|nr:glycoside hydrolase superfamily [Chytriomyces cf. hyalinus JEL632]
MGEEPIGAAAAAAAVPVAATAATTTPAPAKAAALRSGRNKFIIIGVSAVILITAASLIAYFATKGNKSQGGATGSAAGGSASPGSPGTAGTGTGSKPTGQKLFGYFGADAMANGVDIVLGTLPPTTDSSTYQKDLAYYCNTGYFDTINLAFLNEFGGGDNHFRFTFGGFSIPNYVTSGTYIYTGGQTETNSPAVVSSYLNLGKDIKTCQLNGVKVVVSLGGDKVSDYKFSPGDGKRYAQLFYDMFLEGTHPVRPFGPGVVLDGIELDIEKNPAYPGPSPWTPEMIDMINTLRTLSPKTILAIVPQCYLKDLNYNGSDQNVGAVIPAVADKIDYLIVQYYNNPTCSYPFNFNYYEWTKLFKGKIVVGLAGDWTSAISGGFLEPGPLQAVYDEIKSDPQFYGFSVYDVSSSTPPALSKSPATYTNPPPTTYSKTLKDVLSGVTVGSGFPSQAQLGITIDKQYSKRCGGTWVNANQTCSNKACTSNADCGKFEQCFDYMRNC